MLKLLIEVERVLPELLKDEDGWETLLVNYSPPTVERLWRQFGEHRILLHRILPCEPEDALWHPHPWPSAMRIVGGSYEMGVGSGVWASRKTLAAKVIMVPGSSYEMTDPYGWHYVAPLVPTLTVMVVGPVWKEAIPLGVKPKEPLGPLPAETKAELLGKFSALYPF